ncbi:MAG: septum formation inhibitor Maf [Proteobacteria bacterium]|nr:septum formation inhibitor Maf [Pseudomonadota bacterium]
MSAPSLHLASSSPRRHEILTALGLSFSAAGVDIDERRLEGETPDVMVLRLASAKASAATDRNAQLVLGADTAVVLGDLVFGKPRDMDDALNMLAKLSGRTHQVMTGVALCRGADLQTALSVTEVKFREICPDEALSYWQSGEPCDKAGAYAIQGRGGVFVEAIVGSYSGVVGLPVFETARLLREAGLETLIEGHHDLVSGAATIE